MNKRFKKILNFIKKQNSKESFYYKYRKLKICDKTVLLDAGTGLNINGNMFYLAKEIIENSEYKNFKVYFTVTKATLKPAIEEFQFYGLNSVKFVNRKSIKYTKLLATSKYLLSDNSFPTYFIKRKEQIYLNTWHGTPLKTLGKSNKSFTASLGNLQKNYLMMDYALFPNKFTRDVFFEDYMLKNIFKGKVLLCDYPRNSILLDKSRSNKIKKELNLEGKELIAYMPTYRGSLNSAEVNQENEVLIEFFNQIDKKLKENQIFYVNLHIAVKNQIDLGKYKHIKFFPKKYETYDFLNICDQLVTDYSSVFFDYAVSNKKIILFAYDEEKYLKDRGMYIDIHKLPFPIVYTTNELVREINNKDYKKYEEFLGEYCAYKNENNSKKILDLLINDESEGLIIENGIKNKKPNYLILVNSFKDDVIESVNKYINEKKNNNNLILTFKYQFFNKKYLDKFPDDTNYFVWFGKYFYNLKEALAWKKFLKTSVFNDVLRCSFKRELDKVYYNIDVDKIIVFGDLDKKDIIKFSLFSCEKDIYKLSSCNNKVIENYIKNNYKIK